MTSDHDRPPAGVWPAPAALPLCSIGLLGVLYLVLLIVHGACRAAAQRWADVPPAGRGHRWRR